MAELPKLSDLPDDMTIGQLRRMTDMLSQPQAPSTEGFSPQLGATFASAREPTLREGLIDKLTPLASSPSANPFTNSDREAYGAAASWADNPLVSFGTDAVQGAADFWDGSREAPMSPKALGGLGRMVAGSSAVDGSSLFNPDDYRLSPLRSAPDEPGSGFMDAQAGPRKRRDEAPRIGPKAARAAEAGKGEADAIRIRAQTEADDRAIARELQKKKDEAAFDAAAKDKESRTPFRENHPWASDALFFGPALVAGAVGGGARVAANRGLKAGADRLAGLVDEFNAARAAGDLEGATLAKLAMESEKGAIEKAASASGIAKGYAGAGVAGGVTNLGGATLPETYDMVNMPEGPELEHARGKVLSMDGLKMLGTRFGTGALAGMAGYRGFGGGHKRPEAMAKADAASAYGSEKFNGAMGDLAGTGRYKSELGAAGEMVADDAQALVKSNKADLKAGLAGDKAAAPAIPSKGAAKQIEGPKIKPMLDPDIKGKYLANTSKIGQLKDAVAKEESGGVAKPRNRVKISDLRAQISQLENENTQLKAVVMQHQKGFDDLKN